MLDPHTGLYYHRLRRYEGTLTLRFLTFSCFERKPLFRNDLIKDAFAKRLSFARAKFGFLLVAWVVMPTHVHLLLAPREDITVRQILRDLKGVFAQRVIARWRELGAPLLERLAAADGTVRFWQAGGGYDRNITSSDERHQVVAYIHNNPVVDGLARCPEDWAWSSARWYRGDTSGVVEVDV